METKTLAAAIAGFLLGGFTVSVAATLGDAGASAPGLTMAQMSKDLEDRSGDDFDAAFLALMIEHHQGALDMARLSADRAEHDEITELSEAIIDAQRREIAQMRSWQERWGYDADAGVEHSAH